MSEQKPAPDDACEVCGERKDQHGDKHHKFSYDGQLIQLPLPEKQVPKALPPQQRGGHDPQQKAFLRMIERLANKGLLDGNDLLYIFGGIDAPSGGEAQEGAPSAGDAQVT